jgi:uncharacterized membrane protein
MPTILLINDNKIVSRLLQLSSQKHNYALEEISDYSASEDAYNVVFIDSEKFDEDAWEVLKSTLTYDKLGFIGDKTHPKPDGFDLILEKPFLPTDFVSLMDENFKVMDPSQVSDELETIEEIEGEDELDLDNLEEIELDNDLEETDLDTIEDIGEIEVNLDEENLDTGSETLVEPETALTTGIAATMVEDENKDELVDIVNEIDNMENPEKELEEMDLDALAEEEASIEETSIVDDAMVKESLEEVEESLEEELVGNDVEESMQDVSEHIEKEKEELSSSIEEEVVPSEEDEAIATKEESNLSTAAIATGVAATVAAVSSTVTDKSDTLEEDEKEEVEEALNILDGVESIEHEDDYLKESEHVVEDLADEFDSLNEEEVKQILSNEPVEEILSEEIVTEGEEKVVEANDLEEMITRAVAKAITKEMLQEALNDMEISISLKTKKDS